MKLFHASKRGHMSQSLMKAWEIAQITKNAYIYEIHIHI